MNKSSRKCSYQVLWEASVVACSDVHLFLSHPSSSSAEKRFLGGMGGRARRQAKRKTVPACRKPRINRSEVQMSKLELGKRFLQVRSRAHSLLPKGWVIRAPRLHATLNLEQRGTLCGDRSKESRPSGNLAYLAPACRVVLTGAHWWRMAPHCSRTLLKGGEGGSEAPGELREVSGLFLHCAFPFVFQPR